MCWFRLSPLAFSAIVTVRQNVFARHGPLTLETTRQAVRRIRPTLFARGPDPLGPYERRSPRGWMHVSTAHARLDGKAAY